jgi:hypothetical protein
MLKSVAARPMNTAMKTYRGLLTAAAGVLLAALAGCSSLPGFAAAPAASPAPPVPVPASTASPVPLPVLTVATPKPVRPAPALKTTGAAWPAILTSLTGYGQWLLANPDPALVGNIAQPGCAMADLISQQAAGLLADRAVVKPSPPVFGAVTGPSPAPGMSVAVLGSEVTLDVTVSRPAETVVSRTGKQITAFAALPSTALQITLWRAADNKWRFCTVAAASDSGAPDDPSVPLL